VYAVAAGVALAGVEPALFDDDAARAALAAATAAALGVDPLDVGVTGVSAAAEDAAGPAAARHHHHRRQTLLQTGGTQVGFQVFTRTASGANGVASLIMSTGGGPTVSTLVDAGIPTTGVVLTVQPSISVMAAPPAPPPPPLPPLPPPPPAGCGSEWACFAGAACASASTCGNCPAGLAGDGRECAPCTLRVALSASFVGASLPRAADAWLAGSVAPLEASCNATGGFTFAWDTNGTSSGGATLALSAAANSASGPTLRLPARTLAAEQTAAFTLTACFAAQRETCGAATLAFPVTASSLVALLGGGDSVVGETPIVLSGAASFDPDDPTTPLAFAWSCAAAAAGSGACVAPGGAPMAPLGAAATATLTLQGSAQGTTYTIVLTVSSGARSSTVNTTLTVLLGQLPLVSIAGSAALAPGAKVDPAAQLVLMANATTFVTGAVSTRWAVVAQSPQPGALLNLSWAAATPVTSVSLVIRAGALEPGTRYMFSLIATDAQGSVGRANASVTTSTAPRGGWADVLPAAGEALTTAFMLNASGWSADVDELPLSYAAEYTVDGSDEPAVSLTGGAFQASPYITAQLPAGMAAAGNGVTLTLRVRSAFGAIAAANASVSVTWRAFTDAAAAAAFVGDATERAVAALQSGDAASALQVVGGLASLLNSGIVGAATGTTDAVVAAQRALLLSVVSGALAQDTGGLVAPATIESTASLVAQLVASPAQLSGAGTATALGVLVIIASAGVAVSPVAAQSVATALSNVMLAPNASGGAAGGGAPATNFSAVLDVLNALAASQAIGIAVPGQAAATVSTSVLQMSVALHSVGADSPLFSQNISAPGSNASFDPLPADALSAARGTPVSSTFMSLAFDAHDPGSNNSAGITRLAFSTPGSGATVPVANLSTPLLFTLPASTLNSGQQAACAWWDAGAGAYATDGCAALPSPTPPAHALGFPRNFTVGAAGAASLSTAWHMSGALLEGCTLAFLDCTDAGVRASGKLQLDPSSPVAAPVATCGGATDLVLRAYVGTTCALRHPNNTANCAWDVAQQAFIGAGCEAANVTRCMCTHVSARARSPLRGNAHARYHLTRILASAHAAHRLHLLPKAQHTRREPV
jgi:hypothetical protein